MLASSSCTRYPTNVPLKSLNVPTDGSIVHVPSSELDAGLSDPWFDSCAVSPAFLMSTASGASSRKTKYQMATPSTTSASTAAPPMYHHLRLFRGGLAGAAGEVDVVCVIRASSPIPGFARSGRGVLRTNLRIGCVRARKAQAALLRRRRLAHQPDAPPPTTTTPATAAISTNACGLSLPVGTGGSVHCSELLLAVAFEAGRCHTTAVPSDSTSTTFWWRPGTNVVGCPRSSGVGVNLLLLPIASSTVSVMLLWYPKIATNVPACSSRTMHSSTAPTSSFGAAPPGAAVAP